MYLFEHLCLHSGSWPLQSPGYYYHSLLLLCCLLVPSKELSLILTTGNDNDDDHDVLESIIDYNKKWCDFSSSGKYNSDVDFIAVVVLAGIGALLWVSLVFLLLFNSNSKSVTR